MIAGIAAEEIGAPRPTLPRKRKSPVRIRSARTSVRLSLVCPGVWTTRARTSPIAISVPSPTFRLAQEAAAASCMT